MTVKCRSLSIPGIRLIEPDIVRDDRGFFSETFVERALTECGISVHFVQENHAMSFARGVVRGLHFQIPPHAQGKLVRVIRGSILDVAVDIRFGSPTFGMHVSAVVSAENRLQLWIPPGFAHGLCTLEPNTEVLYKVTAYYASDYDHGLRWDDPELAIEWPVAAEDAILSPKDARLPRFCELAPYFQCEPAAVQQPSQVAQP